MRSSLILPQQKQGTKLLPSGTKVKTLNCLRVAAATMFCFRNKIGPQQGWGVGRATVPRALILRGGRPFALAGSVLAVVAGSY